MVRFDPPILSWVDRANNTAQVMPQIEKAKAEVMKQKAAAAPRSRAVARSRGLAAPRPHFKGPASGSKGWRAFSTALSCRSKPSRACNAAPPFRRA